MICSDKILRVLREIDPGIAGDRVIERVTSISRYPVIIKRMDKDKDCEGDESIVDLGFRVCCDDAIFVKSEYADYGEKHFEFVVSYSIVEGRSGYKVTFFSEDGETEYDPPMMMHDYVTQKIQGCIASIGRHLGLDVAHDISFDR